MKGFTPTLVAAILLVTLLSVDATLEESCKQISKGIAGFDVDFCITTLQVVPGSETADTLGLATIAVTLTNTNVTSNLAQAKELLKDGSLPKLSKRVLETCVDTDVEALAILKVLIEKFKSGDHWSIVTDMGAVLTVTSTCVDSWPELGQKSPMAKEEADAVKLAALALNIGASLHQ